MTKKIITDGDSWVFGSEIVDPAIKSQYSPDTHPGAYDWKEENYEYRTARIFPTYLKELIGDADLINLAWPADDNTTILHRIMTYISSMYLSKKIDTSDLFVIVGWSSPERNVFWYKDDVFSGRFRIWPHDKNIVTEGQRKIWELYVTYLWNEEEYLPRLISTIIQFQNFCEKHKIKWLCFNSFYHMKDYEFPEPKDWKDLNIAKSIEFLNTQATCYQSSLNGRSTYRYEYKSLWDTVDNVRFYKKDQQFNTFNSFIDGLDIPNKYNGWHPSPESHKLWAEELFNYINVNNLL